MSPNLSGAENLHSARARGQPTSSSGLVRIKSTPAASKKSRSAVSIYLKKLENNLKKGPALVYFCSPSNPQGKITDYLYIEHLIKIIRKYNSVLIVDECYIDIYYSKKPVGAIEVCEKLGNKLDNIVIFHSLSKRSNVAGLRSGFVIGDSKSALFISEELLKHGIYLPAIRPPTVEEGKSRLRLCIHAFNTRKEVEVLARCLQQ